MIDKQYMENSNEHEDLESESLSANAEFFDYICPEPFIEGANGRGHRGRQLEPEVELLQGEIIEDDPLSRSHEERVLFQAYHRDSGKVFIVAVSSRAEAIDWWNATAQVMAEAHFECGPVQEGVEAQEVPFHRLAQAAYAYCLYNHTHTPGN